MLVVLGYSVKLNMQSYSRMGFKIPFLFLNYVANSDIS